MPMLLYNNNGMITMNKSKLTRSFKFYLPLAILYCMLWFLAIFTNPVVIPLGTLKVSASTFIVILFFSLNDVITEVYGYRMMRKLIWSMIFGIAIMVLLILIMLSLPGLTTWPDTHYRDILSQSVFVATSGIVAAILTSFMNSFFISKWKIILKGKFYWPRSIVSTAISAFFFTCIAYSYRLIHLPISQSLEFIVTAYMIKIAVDLFISFPSTFLQFCLKRLEDYDSLDVGVKYNPFIIEKQPDNTAQ